MENFLWVKSGPKDKEQKLVGTMAVLRLYLDCDKDSRSGKELDPAKMKLINTYSWLLSPAQNAQHSKWVQQLYQAAGGSSSSSSSGKGKGKAAAARTRKAPEKDETPSASSTMNLFKKKPRTGGK